MTEGTSIDINGLIRGNEKSFQILFINYYSVLVSFAMKYLESQDVAEDIVQDVFFELWKRRGSIRFEDAAVKSYLFRAVYTHALNALNKKPQNVCSLEPAREADILDQYVTSYMQNSEQSLLLKELEEEIMSYINTLPPQCHKIFMLSRSYGLKNREIAEQLDISVKAVEKQISKALYGLKQHLAQKDLFPLLALAVTCLSH